MSEHIEIYVNDELLHFVPEDLQVAGDYNSGVDILIQQPKNLERMCQNIIPRSYIVSQLKEKTHFSIVDEYAGLMLLIQYDIDANGKKRGVRGFSLLKLDLLQPDLRKVEVVILCSAEQPSVRVRSASRKGGSNLLKLILKIGAINGGVSLYALENVIPYYSRYGFKMGMDGVQEDESINKLRDFLQTKPSETEITDFFIENDKLSRYGKDFYSNLVEDGMYEAVEKARDSGFFMTWSPERKGGNKKTRKNKKHTKKSKKHNKKSKKHNKKSRKHTMKHAKKSKKSKK